MNKMMLPYIQSLSFISVSKVKTHKKNQAFASTAHSLPPPHPPSGTATSSASANACFL